MKIYIVDFEEVLKNYTNYHDSIYRINSEKLKFSERIDSIKKEMGSIVKSSQAILLDESTQIKNANRFKELQTEAVKIETEFRNDIVELQNKELEENFKEISGIIENWATNANIDLVVNKSQCLFVSEKFDATPIIIELIKKIGLYKEFNESDFDLKID